MKMPDFRHLPEKLRGISKQMLDTTHQYTGNTTTSSDQGAMHSMVFGQSLLAHYLHQRPLMSSTYGFMPADVVVNFNEQKRRAIKVIYDTGNGAAKLCTLYPDGPQKSQLCSIVIPNKWQAATK